MSRPIADLMPALRADLERTAPIVTGHVPAPPGSPTVLLYSH
jgi:hypothetical protein